MNVKGIIEKVKKIITAKTEQFKGLKKEKKIAAIIGVVAVTLSIIFGIMYLNNSKYQVLFSGLDSSDANTITKELESRKVETKVEGDSIYVPREQVDKLRLELSGNISNGSKGFEIMDDGSSFGMTDEEFQIKKQRMTQGEIEKTIKTFPQVESARVHITNGESSVFSKESISGTAAVYLNLKPGASLDPSQVRSIMSLVSASTSNIPKQNVEVIDQNMNLLSEGLFDENGKVNSTSANGLDLARKAEKQMDSDLERAIMSLLEPIFGQGKVKVAVNSDLNFDSNEKTETVVDPNKVIKNESKSENKTTEQNNDGGAVDNNMNNTGNNQNGVEESKEEKTEYEVGKSETKTVTAQGGINKITASVAIDGNLDAGAMKNIQDMVANTIGMDKQRGDDITVVGMPFNENKAPANIVEAIKQDAQLMNILKAVTIVVAALLLIIVATLVTMFIRKRKAKEEEEEFDDEAEIDLINQKLEQMEINRMVNVEGDEESISLEEEVRKYAFENPEQVTDLINNWLNE
ncbi:flagellar basal-body MS-ring/collar protein FliF [Romboutsia sp.]|uniref:flagellar basal-body MS-ring/collar protein FliF n=1 Tax=Romboutsia sp. TaxID=1965302 RepID=UPI003F2B4ECB